MKIIMSIVLIIVMGISNQKEISMKREDGKTEKQVTDRQREVAAQRPAARSPAWLGSQRPTEFSEEREWDQTTRRDREQSGTPSFVNQQFQNRLNQAAGLPTTGTNIPGTTVLMGQNPLTQMQPAQQIPAWLQAISSRINNSPYLNPTGMGGGNAAVPNFNTPQSITQGQQNNDGNVYNNTEQGLTPQGTPTHGVNSFIGGGGDAVIGPNQHAYYPWSPAGVNSFIGGGGEAVRGPGYSTVAVPAPTPVSNNNNFSFGTRYGRGGGYGGGSNWDSGGYDKPAWMSNDPQYMNLYSWNYKG